MRTIALLPVGFALPGPVLVPMSALAGPAAGGYPR